VFDLGYTPVRERKHETALADPLEGLGRSFANVKFQNPNVKHIALIDKRRCEE